MTRPGAGADRIEIVLAGGRRVIVGAGVNATALARVIAVLGQRWICTEAEARAAGWIRLAILGYR